MKNCARCASRRRNCAAVAYALMTVALIACGDWFEAPEPCKGGCPYGGICTPQGCASCYPKLQTPCLGAIGAYCPDFQTDPNNCGACGVTCGACACVNGSCTATEPGVLVCSGGCINPRTDDWHCGAKDCSSGSLCLSQDATCVDGVCQCASGDTRCNWDGGFYCCRGGRTCTASGSCQ